MMTLSAMLSVAAPLVLVDEKSLFHAPQLEDFRIQRISRTDSERDWPFTVDEGDLLCLYIMGKPAVYFREVSMQRGESPRPRVAIVSTDPFRLMAGGLTGAGLLAKTDSIEALIKLLAPFESLGSRLCNQPRGSVVDSGEL
jgi:hypothetical protein